MHFRFGGYATTFTVVDAFYAFPEPVWDHQYLVVT